MRRGRLRRSTGSTGRMNRSGQGVSINPLASRSGVSANHIRLTFRLCQTEVCVADSGITMSFSSEALGMRSWSGFSTGLSAMILALNGGLVRLGVGWSELELPGVTAQQVLRDSLAFCRYAPAMPCSRERWRRLVPAKHDRCQATAPIPTRQRRNFQSAKFRVLAAALAPPLSSKELRPLSLRALGMVG